MFYFLILFVYSLLQTNGSSAAEITACDIPPDIASVDIVSDHQSEKIVYYIHDAHCQPEAQHTIAKLIERIIAYHGDAVIALEGAQGQFNADIFRNFPDKKALADVSGLFVENGSISGAEYLFLNSKNNISLIGAENRGLYTANYNLMTDLLRIQNNAVRSVECLIEQSLSVSEKKLSGPQKKFIQNWSGYEKGEIELKHYALYLSGLYASYGYELNQFSEIEKYLIACRLEENIQITGVESERLSFFDWFTAVADKDKLAGLFTADLNYQLKKITPKEYFSHIIDLAEKNGYSKESLSEIVSYINYLNMVSSLDSVSFHTQLKKCGQTVKDELFSLETERNLIQYLSALYELKSLVGLHLTNTDLENLSHFKDISGIKTRTEKIVQSDLSGQVNWELLERAYKLGKDFYHTARSRDSFMVSNLLEEMESRDCSVGVIIAGGFHRKGICGSLNENSVNHVSVKPSLIKIKDNNRYIALIRNIKTPLERWASDSTLAVASWLSEKPLINPSAKQVKTVVFSSMLVSAAIKNMVPHELVLLRSSLADLVDRAQLYLDAWMKQYSPRLELSNLIMIKDRFAVEILVNGRKIVFLFDTIDSQDQNLPVSESNILEKTQFGDDSVAVVTLEVAEQLRQLALIEQRIQNNDDEQDGIEKLFEPFGLVKQYKSNELSLTIFIRKVNELSRNRVDVSLKDYYAALRCLIQKQLDLFTGSDMVSITNHNEQQFGNFDLNLKPSDINFLAYEFLKQVNSGDGMLSASDFPTEWNQILALKGIDSITFQQNIPYEAVVRMLFDLMFQPPIQPGIVNLGNLNGQDYQARNIKLADGGIMVRIVPALESPAPGESLFEEPFQSDDDTSGGIDKVKDGILLIETDGSFILANMLAFDIESDSLSYTEIRNNSVSLKRGKFFESFLRNFINNMTRMSTQRGFVSRGIIFRDQGGEPHFFGNEDEFIDYIKDAFSNRYLPLRQSGWADSSGRLTAIQMLDFMKRGIILGDLGGGYENFLEIEDEIDLKGKRVLDVGSQLGYNVFYAHLKGAEFAAGVDINPYQQQAAREISAYLQDNIQDPINRVDERIPSLVVAPQGTTNGQLFFRTLDLKEYEEANNVSLAVKPPDNIEFAIADARNLPYEDDSFDVVMSGFLLPYITNPSVALAEMIRVAKSGAIIQFNYFFNKKTDSLILEEACSILASNHNLQIGYVIGGRNDNYMLVKITSKKKTEDVIEAFPANGRRFTNKSSGLPNNFDSKPYLDPIYPPITALPVDYNTLYTAPVDSFDSIPGIKGREKVALAFTKQMLDRLYSKGIFGNITKVEISDGSAELVSVFDDTLIIDKSALSNPYILFSLVEQTLVSGFINGLPNEFFYKYEIPAELISLYKDVLFIQYFPQQLLGRFSENQVRKITAALRGAAEKDTALEFQADMLGKILEQSLTKTMSAKKLIYEVLKQTLDLPEHQHLKTSSHDIGALFDDGVISLFAIESIENLSWQINNLFQSSYSKRDFAFEVLSPLILEQAVDSVNPNQSIREYIDFLPYLKNIQQFGTNIPDNLAALLGDEMFVEIFQKYPAVGFYVLKDMIKSVVNDPANPPLLPFLMDLDSNAVMAVIQNINGSINKKLPSFENGVEQAIPILEAMPPTAWIGPILHGKLVEMNQGEPYRVLSMELKTDDEDVFLRKLDNRIILNDIQDDELVALKITRKTTKDGGEALDVYIVVDTLEEIRNNSQLVAGLSTFTEHEVSYKKTFSVPVNATKSSFISFSPQLQLAGGIGSEFIRNEIALFQQAGMANTAVNIFSKEIRVFSMLEREINAKMVMNLFWDRILPESRQAQELAALFFRIGILDRAQLDSLWDLATSEEDVINEMKSIFETAVDQSTENGEIFLQMFNRKTRAFVHKKARLNEIKDIYAQLSYDPFVTGNYPEIRDQYKTFQTYEDLAIETPVYNMEPLTLGMESDLINRIPEFEEDLLSYVNTDILDNVVIPNNLFAPSTDLTETYGQFASYVSRILPFVDLLGSIPSEIRDDNVKTHVDLFFRTAAHLSEHRNPQEISEILRGDNVWGQLANEISSIRKSAVIRQAVQSLFYSLLQEKTLSEKTLKIYFRFFNDKGLFDGEVLANSGQWAINVIKTNPKGAGVVFFSLASLFIDNPRESTELFTRLMAVEGADFVSLVQYAASVNADTFLNELPDILTIFESGLRDEIQLLNGIGGETYGRLNLLLSNNSVILPDVLDHSKFIIQVPDRQTDPNGFFRDGFSSLELAGTLNQWLNEKGVDAKLMRGESIVSGEQQFFLRIGNVNVGLSPFSDFINPDYQKVTSINQTEFKEAYDDGRYFVNLDENQPLLWRNLNKQMETYFTGRLQTLRVGEIDYVDFQVESNIRNGDGTLYPQTSVLRVPTANLFDLYESVTSVHPDKALQVISRFKHANLSFTSTSDDVQIAKFRANYFNDIFYQVISRMDPMWMFAEKVDNLVNRYSQFDAVSLADKMVLANYSELSSIAQQLLVRQQLTEQAEEKGWNSDKLHAFNSVRTDLSVILIDSYPVGWVLGEDIYLAEPLLPAELFFKEKISKKEGHSFSPFIKSSLENTSFTNLAVFSPTEYGSIDDEVGPAVSEESFDSAYYKQELSRALINAGFKIKDMFKDNMTVQVVQDYWRLGGRQLNNVDGSTSLIIDIDAFRDPFLLEFVLRHELVSHQGAGGEAFALINDIFVFRNLSSSRQQHLLDILRKDNIDMLNFADILEKSRDNFSLDIINDIIAYISDSTKYPQLSLELKGMSGNEVYRYLSHQLNDELASRLESFELDSSQVLKLTMHPQFNDLNLALNAIDKLDENPVFPEDARETVFSYLLENKLDADAIAEVFYDMDIFDTAFRDLFFLFGPEIVPVLLLNAKGDAEKIKKFEQFMITFGKSFGEEFKYSINHSTPDQYLKTVTETELSNIERFYRPDGSLYVENVYDHVDWYNVVPEQTEQMAIMCEEFFGKNIEQAITVMDGFLERRETALPTDASIQKDMEKLLKLVSQMMQDYRTVKFAKRYLDLRNVPLSKQEIAIEINTQFVSDLIGSPLTFGLGMIQLADSEINETPQGKEVNFDEVIRCIEAAREGLVTVRQLLIRYRIMKDYRIALNDDNHMISFNPSMQLDINTPIREQKFYPESAVAEQIKSQMDSENDVYVVYFSGHETNSIRFISDIMDKLDAEQTVRVVVVSPQLDTDVVESLLSEFNIAQAASLILGKDILSKSDIETVSGSDIVSLIEDNVDNPPDNVIFLSDQTLIFSDLMQEGMTVLPLPDIKQIPKPYSPSLGRKAIIDQAA